MSKVQIPRKPEEGFICLIEQIVDDPGFRSKVITHRIARCKNIKSYLKRFDRINLDYMSNKILHYIPTEDVIALEKYFLDHFAQWNLINKWFNLPNSAIAEFINYHRDLLILKAKQYE